MTVEAMVVDVPSRNMPKEKSLQKLPVSFTWDIQKEIVETTPRFIFFSSSNTRTVTETHSLTLTAEGLEFDSRFIPWADLWSVNGIREGAISLKLKRVNHRTRTVGMSEWVHIPVTDALFSTLDTAITATQKKCFQFPDLKGYRFQK